MCKKLIIFCLTLAVIAALSVPALAYDDPNSSNALKVDLTYAPETQAPQAGWQGWGVIRDWGSPQTATFGGVTATLSVQRRDGGTTGGARNRSGGIAFVPHSGVAALGVDVISLKLAGLKPTTSYLFNLWSFERFGVWAGNGAKKYAAWLPKTNPISWLVANGYEDPNGYTAAYPTGMPADLYTLLTTNGDRINMMSPLDGQTPPVADWKLGDEHGTNFYATTNSSGVITIYGWLDVPVMSGSFHVPLNGFRVAPEPATMALLGLGGLALLRRRKRA